jgi:hypothetical protein
MSDPDVPFTHRDLHSILQRKVGLQAKLLGVCGVDAHRSACRLPHFLQRPNMVWMTMREQNAPNT